MNKVTFEKGRYFKEYKIPLGMSIPISPSVLRIGEFAKPCKCTLMINDEKQIDSLIDRLLEIRKLFVDNKENVEYFNGIIS